MTKNQKIIFWSILLLAVILIFFRLGRQDMLGDDGHYAFRGIGYYDYVASLRQTTPVQWFGTRPEWSYLSFHDHPPLFFLLQHIFFLLFGESVVVSRLVSAFAALGSVLVVYKLGKKLTNRIGGGLLSATVLAVNSYFISDGRIGHLEALFTFFLLLGILYFVKAISEDSRHFKLAGLFFGLALLSKYSFLFAIPPLFLYLVWKGRAVFKNRQFWYGVLIFILVALPIIVYNLAMYKTRGHFDVQFSDLFGQPPSDWPILQSRVNGFHFNFLEVGRNLAGGFSLPVLIAFSLALLWGLWRGWRKKAEAALGMLPVLMFVSFYVFFSLVGGASRWVGIMSPFAAIAVGQLAAVPFTKLQKIFLVVPGILLAVFSLLYTVNSNHLSRALGDGFWYSYFRVENLGYNQLDKKISSILDGKTASENFRNAAHAIWYSEMKPAAVPFFKKIPVAPNFDSLIIYDQNMNWFATMWLFERWKFYHGALIISSLDFFKIAQTPGNLEKLNLLGVRDIYYIASGEQVKKESKSDFAEGWRFVDAYGRQGLKPEIVHDDKGREAFYIYNSETLDL